MMNVEDAAEVQRLHQEAARMKQEAEITMTVANNLVSNAAANIAHNVRPPGRDHISMRPPVCGSDFRSFTRAFKLYLDLMKIQDATDMKRSLLLAASTTKNMVKLQPYYKDVDSITIGYDQFEQKLIDLFCPQSQSLMARREFANLRQAPDQNFTEFWSEKLSLYSMAFPEENPSPEQTKYFVEEVIKSLANVSVKRELVRKQHQLDYTNLRTEITNAIQAEDTMVSFNISETGTRDGLLYSEQFSRFSDNNPEPMDIGEVRPGRCRACNQYGHWQKECPQQKKRPVPRRYPNNQDKKKPEMRTCHRCLTKGHLKGDCRIPEAKLEAVKKKNRENKGKQAPPRNNMRAVKQIETKEDEEDDSLILEAMNAISEDKQGFQNGE